MKAIVVTRTGGPDSLEVQEIPGPEPKENQLLVNVRACGVNFADILMASGTYAGGPKPPFIAGREFSGRVLSTGENVMGYAQANGFAERIVTRREFLWEKPDAWSFEEAAAFPVNYFTAFFAYWWAGLWAPAGQQPSRVSQGKPSVLIHAVAGGVGTAAVQIGKLLGVEMYGTSSSDEKLAKAQQLGLNHPINYKELDYEKVVCERTKNQGVDAVLEMLGGEHTAKSTRCLKFGGRVIVYGSATGAAHHFDTRTMYAKNCAVHGLWLSPLSMHPEYMEPAWKQLSEWIAQGHLRPQVGHVYPIEKAPEAFRTMLERKNYGKLVLKF
ncbi:MAG TPA: NADPH:quinone oxidoreductase family protein [Terriglobales bacterium]|nr:NADPH:quinone oxidoreductase family protein [Terriglobales bacterium]